MNDEYQKTILLTVMCLIAVWMGVAIFTNGMFFDGIVYAAVANNLAHGIGSLWHFEYSPTFIPDYAEQPPLMILIQSWFFRLLGDGLLVERIYCLLFAGWMVYVIRAFWREFHPDNPSSFWYPVLLWALVPIISWTYQNNLQEVTMAAFDGTAVLWILYGCRRKQWFWFVAGGIMVFLASFTKGIQGLFPLAVPFFYGLILGKGTFWKMMGYTFILVSICLGVYTLLLQIPEANEFYRQYVERRLVGTFDGIQDTTTSHFYLLFKLLGDLLIPAVLCGMLWLWLKQEKETALRIHREALLFICIGLCASLPLMITLEQRKFYLANSIPYFSLGMALFTGYIPEKLALKMKSVPWNYKRIRWVAGIVLISLPAVLPLLIAIPKRDRDMIEDLKLIQAQVPEYSILAIPTSMASRWSYHAYFMRYNHLALDEKNLHPFFLAEASMEFPPDSCYQTVSLPLKKFRLYHCPEKN